MEESERKQGSVIVDFSDFDMAPEMEELLRDTVRQILELGIKPRGIDFGVDDFKQAIFEPRNEPLYVFTLDHSYENLVKSVKDILASNGFPENQVAVPLASVFFRSAVEPLLEQYMQVLEDMAPEGSHSELDYGCYGVWDVLQQTGVYPPQPAVTFYYNDPEHLLRVWNSGKIPSQIYVDTGHENQEVADVLHTLQAREM